MKLLTEQLPHPVISSLLGQNILLGTIAQNGPVYVGIPCRNFFLFLNFIPALINIYYINLSFYILFL
jgi:hypothetical protein